MIINFTYIRIVESVLIRPIQQCVYVKIILEENPCTTIVFENLGRIPLESQLSYNYKAITYIRGKVGSLYFA